MRRALVLTDESARHPFLARLPAHVRSNRRTAPKIERKASLQALKDFLLAYCACFVAVSAFLM
jgi:hypothetical protein